jgi:hypothetical protein
MRDPFGPPDVEAQQYREWHTDPRNHKRDSGFKRNNPSFIFTRALASSAHIGEIGIDMGWL